MSSTPPLQEKRAPRARASHPKSRKGCFTCKSRKIKCDEIKPRCGACQFRNTECIYPSAFVTNSTTISTTEPQFVKPFHKGMREILPAQGQPASESPTFEPHFQPPTQRHGTSDGMLLCYVEAMQHLSGVQSDSSKSSPAEIITDHTDSGSSHIFRHETERPRSQDSAWRYKEVPPPTKPLTEPVLTDLGLMVHWCTSTAKNIDPSTTKRQLWTDYVPYIASKHACLMHSILACSALHLVTSTRSLSDLSSLAKGQYASLSTSVKKRPRMEASKELQMALSHQSAALVCLGTELQRLSDENIHAVALTTVLLVLMSFGLNNVTGNRNRNSQGEKVQTPHLEWYTLLHHMQRFGALIQVFLEGPLAEAMESHNIAWMAKSLAGAKAWPGTLKATQQLQESLDALDDQTKEILQLQKPSNNWRPFLTGMNASFQKLRRLITTYDNTEPSNVNDINTYESYICAVEVQARLFYCIFQYHMDHSPPGSTTSTTVTPTALTPSPHNYKSNSNSKSNSSKSTSLFQIPLVMTPAITESAYLAWATETSPAYTQALQDSRPRALIILAHFYVMPLLDEHGHGLTWKRTCAVNEILKIERLLRERWDSEKWEDVMKWPVDAALAVST